MTAPFQHASFKGLRDDKSPTEVVRESTADQGSRAQHRTAPRFHLTHPDRVFWPDIGLTKQGLAEFYEEISD
jgi:bifunctional non-homologous end joining protein LigD